MTNQASFLEGIAVPQGPRNSIRSLRKQPAAEPSAEISPRAKPDLRQGMKKEEEEGHTSRQQKQDMPAEGSAAEQAVGKNGTSAKGSDAAHLGHAGKAGDTAGSAENLADKTTGQAAGAAATGTAGASAAASAGGKAAGALQAVGHEAGALSASAKAAGGSAAGDGLAGKFWSSTSGQVGAVAAGVLVVAAAAAGAGGGGGDGSGQNAQSANPPGNTGQQQGDAATQNDRAQDSDTPGSSTSQPPSMPQSEISPETAPTYGPTNVSKASVAHDASVKMASEVFAGTGEPPAFIRITGITPHAASPGAPALLIHQGTGDEKPLAVGAVISRADFDKLSWDSAANNGGKFSFVALNSSQQPFEGLAEQTVEIRESRVAPDYPADRPAENLIHDAGSTLPSALFAGTDSYRQPDFIRITAVKPSSPGNDQSPLLLDAGTPQEKPLAPDAVIAAADFGKISWNTTGNTGGTFSFQALDADREPILGSAPQTIVIHELPAHAPGYPATQPMQHVPHEQTLALPATVLAGSHSDRQPHAIRIESLDVQNPAEETLALHIDRDGSGPAEPESLKVGDTIAQADFGKLRWSSEGNTGGRFSFSALDAQGQKIDGVPEQMVHIHESPETPDYPGVSTAAVQFQSLHALGDTLFAGEESARKPQFVRITDVSPQGAAGDTPVLHIDRDGAGGAAPSPVREGQIISAEDFGKLLWDSRVASFGSLAFEALDASQHAILQAGGSPVTQTVQVFSHPKPPQYPEDAQSTVTLAHDSTLSIQPLHFTGADAEHSSPAQIRILAISPAGAQATGGLMIDRDGNGPEAPVAVQQDDTIDRADFDKLHWNGAGNEGGRITFEALAADETRILGSREQTLVFDEHPAAPTYASPTSTVAVANGATLALDDTLLKGTGNAPEAIRITSLPGDANAVRALILDKGGAGEKVLQVGDVVLAADFGKLSWDASVADGGHFSFIPVLQRAGDTAHVNHAGASEQRVDIRESGVAPDYSGTPVTTVAHNGSKLLPDANLIGAAANRKPAAVRIDSITLNNNGTDANALMLDRDGPDTGAPAIAVQVGTVIEAADFGKLTWNALNNEGGTVQFTALEDSSQPGQPYQPLLAQNGQAATGSFSVHESPRPPEYAPNPGTQGATSHYFKMTVHDGTASYIPSAFAGLPSRPANPEAAFIRIEAINENADTNTAESALRVAAGGGAPMRLLKVGDIVEASEFARISWNTNGNEGGTFTFVPMDASRQVIEGAAPLTYQVYESPVAPTYDASKQKVMVSHDQTQNLDRSLFAGTNPGTEPAGVRITRVVENNDTDPGNTGLQVMRSGTPVNLAAGPNQFITIPATEFDGLRWNANGNTGGTFTFQALDENGRAILGSPEQTITITEAAPVIPPTYPAGNEQRVVIPYAKISESEVQLDKSLFIGSTPNTTMGGIIITQTPTEVEDQATHRAPLSLSVDAYNSNAVTAQQFIPADKLHLLTWDAQQNKGGTITFRPVDDNENPIPGVAEQTIVLTEGAAPLPAYPAGNAQTVNVVYNKMHSLDRTILAGTDPGIEPEKIRITAIDNPNTSGVDSGLRAYRNHAPVKVGDEFLNMSLAELSWNAVGSTGGSFKFVALDKNGAIIGSEQTVTITENGPVLAAVSAPQAQTVTHDGITVLNASSFLTTDPARSTPGTDTLQNRWFRITGVTETSDAAGSVGTRFQAWRDDTGETAYELIKVAGGISKDEAASRAQAMGGKLWTISGNENWAVQNGYLIRHSESFESVMHQDSTASTLNAFVVEFENHQGPLRQMRMDDSDPASARVMTPGYVVGNSTDPNGGSNHHVGMDRIIWDSTRNSGGTITLEEVSGWSPWDPDDENEGPRNRDEWLQQNPGQTPPDEIRKPGTQSITITLTEAARGAVLTRSMDEDDAADAEGSSAADGAAAGASAGAGNDAAAAASAAGSNAAASISAADAATGSVLTPAELLGGQAGASSGSAASAASATGSGPVDAGGRWFFSPPTLLDDNQQTMPTV